METDWAGGGGESESDGEPGGRVGGRYVGGWVGGKVGRWRGPILSITVVGGRG